MARTKGATGKKNVTTKVDKIDREESIEEPKSRGRGRQKGDAPTPKEPVLILNLNKDFRIKMEEKNFVFQEKGKALPGDSIDEFDDDDEAKDKGWKFRGYHSPNIDGLIEISRKMIVLLANRTAKKDEKLKMEWEEYLKYLLNSIKEISKIFKPLGIHIDASKYINEILKLIAEKNKL